MLNKEKVSKAFIALVYIALNIATIYAWSLAIQNMAFLSLFFSKMSETINEAWLSRICGGLAVSFAIYSYKAFMEPSWNEIKQHFASLRGLAT